MKVLGYEFNGEKIRCHEVHANGALTLLSATPPRQADRYQSLFKVDPKGKWLCIAKAFDTGAEGWTLDSPVFKPSRKTTSISFYRLSSSGLPRFQKALTVPGIALQLVPCPTGRRLFINGGTQIVTITTHSLSSIRVSAVKTETGSYSFKSGGSERDATHLSISPDGQWAFAFDGDGFGDHRENYLQVYKVGASGRLIPVGNQLANLGEMASSAGPAELLADGATLLMKISPYGGHSSFLFQQGKLSRETRLQESMKFWQLDPRGRFVYGHYERQNARREISYYLMVYRKADPGKLMRVATYAEISGALALEPLGRFVYDQGPAMPGKQLPTLRTWKVLADGRLRCMRKVASELQPQDLYFVIL